jgi:hypothetical protein
MFSGFFKHLANDFAFDSALLSQWLDPAVVGGGPSAAVGHGKGNA